MKRVFICPECGNIVEFKDNPLGKPDTTCFCRWPHEVIQMEELERRKDDLPEDG